MTKKTIEEDKIVSDDGYSSIESPVIGAGGEVKDRLADEKKEANPEADTLKTETPVEGGGEVKARLADQKDTGEKETPHLKEEDEKESETEEEETSEDEEEEKEDVKESDEAKAIFKVFEGVEISEDTKRKISLIFEAAVELKTKSLVEAKSKELEETYAAKYEADKVKMDEEVRTFMEETAKEWMEENKIAIEESKKVMMAESLLESIKEIFSEHNIVVEDTSKLVIEGLEAELQEAIKKSEKILSENIAITKQLDEMKKDAVLSEITEGLTTSQAEKLRSLSNKIVMENIETYKSDIMTIKETFFASNKPVVKEEKEEAALITESKQTSAYSTDPEVDNIIKAITARKK